MLIGDSTYIFNNIKQIVIQSIKNRWSFVCEPQLSEFIENMSNNLNLSVINSFITHKDYNDSTIVKGRINYNLLIKLLLLSIKDAYLKTRNCEYYQHNKLDKELTKLMQKEFEIFDKSRRRLVND